MQSTSSLLRLAALTLFFVPAALFAQALTAPPSPEQSIEPPDAPGHGEGSPAPPAAPELTVESRSRFDRIWKQVMMTYLKYDHLAAQARLNGGDRQYVYAEMEGGRETVGYTFDRVDDFKERLFHFHKRQGSDIRFENQLSEQPI